MLISVQDIDRVNGRRRAGFTVLELIVVVIVVGILALLGRATYTGARTEARWRVVETTAQGFDRSYRAQLKVMGSSSPAPALESSLASTTASELPATAVATYLSVYRAVEVAQGNTVVCLTLAQSADAVSARPMSAARTRCSEATSTRQRRRTASTAAACGS